MNKRQLLRQLRNDVYCRLGPSQVHGVGVFAVRDIPQGTNPFNGCDNSRYVKIRRNELEGKGVDSEVLRLLTDMCVFEDGHFLVPSRGLQSRDISYYLNHSDNPNMVVEGCGNRFVAKRDIQREEELFVDYNTYDELDESYRPK